MAKRVRPNTTVFYSIEAQTRFGGWARVEVTVYPQQTWEAERDRGSMILRNYKKHITMRITMSEYEKHWVEKE